VFSLSEPGARSAPYSGVIDNKFAKKTHSFLSEPAVCRGFVCSLALVLVALGGGASGAAFPATETGTSLRMNSSGTLLWGIREQIAASPGNDADSLAEDHELARGALTLGPACPLRFTSEPDRQLYNQVSVRFFLPENDGLPEHAEDLTPVSEPATWIAALLIAGTIAGSQCRRFAQIRSRRATNSRYPLTFPLNPIVTQTGTTPLRIRLQRQNCLGQG